MGTRGVGDSEVMAIFLPMRFHARPCKMARNVLEVRRFQYRPYTCPQARFRTGDSQVFRTGKMGMR